MFRISSVLTSAALALSLGAALSAPVAALAQCGAAHNSNKLAPAFRSLHEPAAQAEENDLNQAASPKAQGEEKNDRTVSVLGLWKKVYFSDGVLNDIGFAQFSAGGTELLNDVGAFNAGNNFCMGVWKQVGRRTYNLVHTFFVFEGNTAVGVSIEKSVVIVSRDGNRFTGTWNQDNYDLYGALKPGTHAEGTISGTRITTEPDYPFPLPL